MKRLATRAPAVALVALFLVTDIGIVIHTLRNRPVSPAFAVLYFVGVSWAISWWVLADCRERMIEVSIDHGWFVFYAWPLVLPYHLIRTRGLGKGCGYLAALAGLFLASYLIALGLYFVLR